MQGLSVDAEHELISSQFKRQRPNNAVELL